MDKNIYETYEFLPSNDNSAEPEQYFVVQNDGAFLVNRQVQYVTQVHNDKTILEDHNQPCTVFDISPQQFYVGVESTTELIPITDQLILPEDNGNIYPNNYLLQPVTNTITEQIEDVSLDNYSHNSQEVISDKQANNCTEITLSDEQYQTLGKKGWILLEFNDKIYVLNGLGLHDITTNDKLIQNLRSEMQNDSDGQIDFGLVKPDDISKTYEFANILEDPKQEQLLVQEHLTDASQVIKAKDNRFPNYTIEGEEHKHDITDEQITYGHTQLKQIAPIINTNAKKSINIDQDLQTNDKHSVKIKTKYTFKDIPKKIFLGTSANGKKLYAKVSNINNKKKYLQSDVNKGLKVTYEIEENCDTSTITESQFYAIIQESIRFKTQQKGSVMEMNIVDTVLSLLLKVPNLRSLVTENKLIITKAAVSKDDSGKSVAKNKPTLVTGYLKLVDENNSRFIHMPNMLEEIVAKLDENNVIISRNVNNASGNDKKIEMNVVNIIHVHMSETTCAENMLVSVSVNKRGLTPELLFNSNARYLEPIFACGACALVFQNESQLLSHQENQCIDTDDMLTIDTAKMNQSYTITQIGGKKLFSCNQCGAKFPRRNYCERHIKTHSTQPTIKKKQTEQKDVVKSNTEKNPLYKCKMCCCTYTHKSSLSKHILKKHIQTQSHVI